MSSPSTVVCYPSDTHPSLTNRCCVLVPQEYGGPRALPVVFLLHGVGERENDWTANRDLVGLVDSLVRARFILPIAIVMPCGFVTDEQKAQRQMPERASFETVLGQTIEQVQSHYPHLSRSASERAIAGISMGGKQAIEFALGHPDQFSAIGALSAAIQRSELGATFPVLADPAKLRNQLSHCFLRCGAQDALKRAGGRRTEKYDLAVFNENFANTLRKAGVDCDAAIEDGYHDWDFWNPQLAPLLTSIATVLAPSVAVQSLRGAICMAVHTGWREGDPADPSGVPSGRLRLARPVGWPTEKFQHVLRSCECVPADSDAAAQLMEDAGTILLRSLEIHGDQTIDLALPIAASHWRVAQKLTASSLEARPWKSSAPSYMRRKWVDDVPVVLLNGPVSSVLATLRSTKSLGETPAPLASTHHEVDRTFGG